MLCRILYTYTSFALDLGLDFKFSVSGFLEELPLNPLVLLYCKPTFNSVFFISVCSSFFYRELCYLCLSLCPIYWTSQLIPFSHSGSVSPHSSSCCVNCCFLQVGLQRCRISGAKPFCVFLCSSSLSSGKACLLPRRGSWSFVFVVGNHMEGLLAAGASGRRSGVLGKERWMGRPISGRLLV